MRTVICSILFPDGAKVAATLSADTPEAEARITYDGAVDRLPARFETGNAALLKTVFKTAADHHHVTYNVNESGDYEAWAV